MATQRRTIQQRELLAFTTPQGDQVLVQFTRCRRGRTDVVIEAPKGVSITVHLPDIDDKGTQRDNM